MEFFDKRVVCSKLKIVQEEGQHFAEHHSHIDTKVSVAKMFREVVIENDKDNGPSSQPLNVASFFSHLKSMHLTMNACFTTLFKLFT